jgi:pyruvate,orthophosphate dikinase
MTSQLVFDFQNTGSLGSDILGGKALGLAMMTQLGIPVPPGFVATTEVCGIYYREGRRLPDSFWAEFDDHLVQLEGQSGKRVGGLDDPQLVSVRSGAPISMPGMMDTVLNVGLNDETVEALAVRTGDRRFALDSYRRLLQMYGQVVSGIDKTVFDHELDTVLLNSGVPTPIELSEEALEALITAFKGAFVDVTGEIFVQDPRDQIRNCLIAVFESWNGKRAETYRQMEGISGDLGTAASVVSMVYGNLGENSGTGVCFTRNPSTGEPGLFGEFLQSAQGEDVVSGERTPEPVSAMSDKFPAAYAELIEHAETLERYNRDMQDIEFTIERGKLFILQTRNGKRTAQAAVRVAVDLVEEGLLSKEEALVRVEPSDLSQLLSPQLPEDHGMDVVARGLNASPGAAVGFVVLDADTAESRAAKGEHVILVRPETSPDDIHGFIAAEGILTAKGGLTSHAAVVARGMGKPCITGCQALEVDLEARVITIAGVQYSEGTLITIDGTSGSVIIGEPELTLVSGSAGAELDRLLEWADSIRRLKVLANADTPIDAENARRLGAEGIGLCRTEHMFFGVDRLPKMQAMILATNLEDREDALAELQPMQSEDFFGIFSEMGQDPVIIRLLDPPLHEFLPDRSEVDSPAVLRRIDELSEVNPMLGMRGCRLGLVYPEIYEMQVKAIADAAIETHASTGLWPKVQIMLPMVAFPSEMESIRANVERVLRDRSVPDVQIGMMIELPRTCVSIGDFAGSSDFFSFGTNDLTQTTLGFSRDDAENMFLGKYLEDGILEENPFETLDVAGVGGLIDFAVNALDYKAPDVSLGACGEHGGDPASIKFFHEVGLSYVSCSPFRIPIARLAAAQAAINSR